MNHSKEEIDKMAYFRTTLKKFPLSKSNSEYHNEFKD